MRKLMKIDKILPLRDLLLLYFMSVQSSIFNKSRVSFWPNRGSKKERLKIAKKYGKDTIWRIPRSIGADSSQRRVHMTQANVGMRVADSFQRQARPLQAKENRRVKCLGESII